jgi:hypothetical protein
VRSFFILAIDMFLCISDKHELVIAFMQYEDRGK